mmetsp:Transcript_24864/g.40674  ORF Transcript_24864/g.40674 Transcript_24864/m.40674 type:complete len:228 (+) Transcript_24864:69-752(+)
MNATLPRSSSSYWTVRPARPQDQAMVQDLLYQSYSNLLANDYGPELLAEALPIICKANPELLSCGTWYVVEANTAATRIPSTGNAPEETTTMLVGCGGFTWQAPIPSTEPQHFQNDSVTTPHLRHFATHPKYARQGIARAIWNKCRHEICKGPPQNGHHHQKTNHLPTMEVYSTLTAVAFYASLGFETVQEVTLPLRGVTRNKDDSTECIMFPAMLMRREQGRGKKP